MTINYQDLLSGLDLSPRAIQAPDDTPNEPEAPREVNVVQMPAPLVKGNPIRICSNVTINKIIETEIDMRNFNMLHVQVRITGTSPSATITVLGSDDGGNFIAVPDASGTKTAVTTETSFDVQVGSQRAKVQLSSISGTYTNDQGYSIIVTPFIGAVDSIAIDGTVGLAAGSNLVGKVQVRNNADSANIDPVAEGTFTGRMGEVQDTPTAYTALRRLKDLLTGIVLATGTNSIGKLAANSGVDIGDVDVTSIAAGETHIGALGGAKARISAAFTRPANTTAYTAKDALGVSLAVSDATNASPIVITCDTHSLTDGDPVTIASVGGNTAANGNFFAKVTGYSTTTFGVYSDKALATPVAGNGAYTSGGTVARLMRFTNVARVAAGSGYIVKATIQTDQTTNTEAFRLHLFNAPPAAILDNAACTSPLYADASKYVGTIDFPACKVEGTGATAAYANVTGNIANSNLPMGYVCAATDRDLYAIPETPAGFTPASGQQITVVLVAEND